MADGRSSRGEGFGHVMDYYNGPGQYRIRWQLRNWHCRRSDSDSVPLEHHFPPKLANLPLAVCFRDLHARTRYPWLGQCHVVSTRACVAVYALIYHLFPLLLVPKSGPLLSLLPSCHQRFSTRPLPLLSASSSSSRSLGSSLSLLYIPPLLYRHKENKHIYKFLSFGPHGAPAV